uniref:F-box/LRR-repeat protein At3g48880-like n=2 Tax=Cicer arietinum TaxID=3827 RepID=A0A1S2XQP2_CICAR|nr:F-box/LRR-repeat protein At3g48880-like [Cicer arietinum]
MKRRSSNRNRKYSNDYLFYEILVKIFTTLNVMDRSLVGMVCKSWNLASRDPSLWKKLDLTTLCTRCFYVRLIPINVWIDEYPSNKMTQFLKYASSLGGGNVSTIILNYYVYLRDEHLISLAERTPNVKRLVLPVSGNITKNGIESAMRSWRGLESITITSIVNDIAIDIFVAIGKYSLNILRLKFTCYFDLDQAEALVKYTPNLKELSIRNILVNMRGLCLVLNSLKHLEVVNICHSLIMDNLEGGFEIYDPIDHILKYVDVSCLKKLIICEKNSCLRCKNGRKKNVYDYRTSLPYRHLEDIWREDEISSLAH